MNSLIVCALVLCMAFAVPTAFAGQYAVVSGFNGVHRCTLPACDDYSQIVPGTASTFAYALYAQVNSAQSAVYWLSMNVEGKQEYSIDGCSIADGSPLPPNAAGNYTFAMRPSQDYTIAFDHASGLLYMQDHAFQLSVLDPSTRNVQLVAGSIGTQATSAVVQDSVLYYLGTDATETQSCIFSFSVKGDAKAPTSFLCSSQLPPAQWQPALLTSSSSSLFVLSADGSSGVIVDISTAEVTKSWGLPSISSLATFAPKRMSVDSVGNLLYLCGSPSAMASNTLAIAAVDLSSFDGRIVYQDPLTSVDICMGIDVTV
jgi:hypothetical protein